MPRCNQSVRCLFPHWRMSPGESDSVLFSVLSVQNPGMWWLLKVLYGRINEAFLPHEWSGFLKMYKIHPIDIGGRYVYLLGVEVRYGQEWGCTYSRCFVLELLVTNLLLAKFYHEAGSRHYNTSPCMEIMTKVCSEVEREGSHEVEWTLGKLYTLGGTEKSTRGFRLKDFVQPESWLLIYATYPWGESLHTSSRPFPADRAGKNKLHTL